MTDNKITARRVTLAALAALALTGLACSNFILTDEPEVEAPAEMPTAIRLQPTLVPTSAGAASIATVAPPGELLPTAAPADLDLQVEETLLIDLYKRVNPAVVFILVTSNLGDSLGSGFVIDTDGHIVTNHHVVEGAEQIEVAFASGARVYATVVGTDQDADLAVLDVEVPPEQLTVVELGDSDLVQVGQQVVAIGNPFGLAGTMTVGIVSGLGRTLSSDRASGEGRFSAPDIIQTDAAINPGNSGGPLLDLTGKVIGVNRAITSETGVNSGVGFAVAINLVRRIVPDLIANGSFVYPYLGISSADEITLAQQQALGLPQSTGVYIIGVTADGPAAGAGLRAGSRPTEFDGLLAGGDLVTAIDGSPVANFNDLISYLVNHTEVGQTVRLTIIRDGQAVDVDVTLAARP
jgi:2-alkenal reductase